MKFTGAVEMPQKITEKAYWFTFNKNEVAVKFENGKTEIPLVENFTKTESLMIRTLYLGRLDGIDCFASEIKNKEELYGKFEFKPMRSLLGNIEDELFYIVGRAYQIISWDANHCYCGRCGSKMEARKNERVKVCPDCGNTNYPRISPAVIVSVVRDGKILLANANRFNSKMFSVLAGFVEAGETFEDCVKREIKEEVNITVKNIKYFGSQPWPFPDSLMVAFKAEWESGELAPDGEEILSANWFTADELPLIPGKWSIARKLIDSFVEEYGSNKNACKN